MKKWIAFGLGLALSASLASPLYAQDVPAPPPQAAAGLGIIKGLIDLCKAAKAAYCKSCIGKLLSNSLTPMSSFLPCPISCCPAIPAEELLKPGAKGAAARIMKEAAECQERRLAVRYLGTVDCHYYPEAEAGLIAALRGDRCECVRMEAAWALGRGCCCNKRTIAALLITINSKGNGLAIDTLPEETSERVKAAAAVALAHCLSCYVEIRPAAEVIKPGPIQTSLPKKATAELASKSDPFTSYYERIDSVPMPQVVERGRQTLVKMKSSVPLTSVVEGGNGGHSVVEIVAKAMLPQGPTGEGIPIVNTPASIKPMPMKTQGQTEISQVSYHPVASARVTSPRKLEEGGPVTTHVQMLALLRGSVYPERREWAAENMSNFDWRLSPEIVEGLLSSARRDSVPTVRAACIRCLVRMNVNTAPVLTTLHALRSDSDPRVRTEAQMALTRFVADRRRVAAQPVARPSSLTFAATR